MCFFSFRFCSLNHSENWNFMLKRARKIFPNGFEFGKKFFPNCNLFGKIFFPNSNLFGKIFLALLSLRFQFSEWFGEQNRIVRVPKKQYKFRKLFFWRTSSLKRKNHSSRLNFTYLCIWQGNSNQLIVAYVIWICLENLHKAKFA